ncbi:MAG TPA: Ku protein [Tepidisphaeraceae bacterium]|nr:Ku protein [Tepidisphaeraceae bacterium]
MAASRPIWTGTITFGLVNIPVRLHTAVREQRIAFHMLHDQDNVRLRRKMICPADNKEIHPEHVVKGYEIHKNQYIIVQPEDLEACGPKATKTIEITDFVDLDQIDPVYYDRPYYVLPQPTAAKAYRLLLDAMTRSKKVGISKLVMHDKEYLAALRPVENIICLHTMHFGNEVVPAEQLDPPPEHKVGDRELKVAEQLIDSLATKFQPGKYHDEYHDCVLSMIEKKAHGEEIVTQPQIEAKPVKAHDLMAALEASLAEARSQAKGGGNGKSHGHHARRRKSA